MLSWKTCNSSCGLTCRSSAAAALRCSSENICTNNLFNEVFPWAPLSMASTRPLCLMLMANIWSDLFLSMDVFTFSKSIASTASCTNRKQLKPPTSHLNYMTHMCMHIYPHACQQACPHDSPCKTPAWRMLQVRCQCYVVKILSQHLSESIRFMQCHQWHYIFVL